VRGFVSGGLLATWCSRDAAVDVEACFSYLRGVFDTLNAIESRVLGEPGEGDASGIVRCVPERVSVTELRTVFTRHARAHPERLGLQGAVLLAEALVDNYECR
jgi:hypothetical protein